ncbi:acyltransferase [Desmonostoc muscorum LEGE 12446]|uniref:Acyltransferase n=1 Tax=Desmonostoc muscorum LEGE 12446 TaxID=1828758 RepID=A0A8J7D910_DESMC|nr:acyltransferase [Desmonostoc muscorum]MCF2147526.1 acyltransferase [Desmonostoc muscorum LEGE 12446]
MEKSSIPLPGANAQVSSGEKNPHTKFYIPSLDGIRTLAFLLVFSSHAGLAKQIPGGFGVTVFFFLSGYLITTLLRREYDRNQTVDFKLFYLRRLLRIWPSFYLVLFIGTALTAFGLLGGEIYLPAFLSQTLHYANYYIIFTDVEGVAPGSWVYWSLAVEEHFYFLFPLLYLAFRKLRVSPRKQVLTILGLCLAVLVWRCILVLGFGVPSPRTFYATDTRVDGILFGCALAVHNNPILDAQHYSNKVWKYFFLPAGIILILFSLLYRSSDFQETFRYTVQGIGLYPIFFTAIRFPNWGLFAILNINWIRFIGLLSYSLYLVHYTAIVGVQLYLPQSNKFLQAGIALLISLGLAYIIYQFIESPIAKLRKKLSRA